MLRSQDLKGGFPLLYKYEFSLKKSLRGFVGGNIKKDKYGIVRDYLRNYHRWLGKEWAITKNIHWKDILIGPS